MSPAITVAVSGRSCSASHDATRRASDVPRAKNVTHGAANHPPAAAAALNHIHLAMNAPVRPPPLRRR